MKKINPSINSCENFQRGNVPSTVPTIDRRCFACRYNLFAVCWFNERNERLVRKALWEYNEDARQALLKRTDEANL